MKNNIQLIQEIKNELRLLENSVYRLDQQVWAETKQLKSLHRTLKSCTNGVNSSVNDFCRLVSDSAPTTARISALAGQLYEYYN